MLPPLLSFFMCEGKLGVHVAVARHASEDGSARNTHGSLLAGVVSEFWVQLVKEGRLFNIRI